MKKIIALLMVLTLIPQSFVFAKDEAEQEKFTPSVEYQGYDIISDFIAGK